MSPFLSARRPSALLPLTSHTLVHFCPAAMTPGIAVTVYSAGGGGKVAGAAAGAAAPPCAPPARPAAPGPPPRAGGGVLQVAMSAWEPESCVACGLAPGGSAIWAHQTALARSKRHDQ